MNAATYMQSLKLNGADWTCSVAESKHANRSMQAPIEMSIVGSFGVELCECNVVVGLFGVNFD